MSHLFGQTKHTEMARGNTCQANVDLSPTVLDGSAPSKALWANNGVIPNHTARKPVMSKSEIQAEFFNQGTGCSGNQFQQWLVPICALLHEGTDCLPIIPTPGDGGLDMVVPIPGIVYQVFGPDPGTKKIADSVIKKKVAADFPKALATLGEPLRVWRLIINRRGEGLGQKTVATMTALQQASPNICLSVWHLDHLWDELMLPAARVQERLAKLAKILGVGGFQAEFEVEADKLLDEAGDLAGQGKFQDAFDKTKQAYAIVKPHGLAEPLMRVLASLIIVGGKLSLGDSLQRYGKELDSLLPQVSNPKSQVNYYRAKVTLAHLARDLLAEREAAQQGMASLEKLDDDFSKAEYCCFCRSLIAIACREKDLDQAKHWIAASTAMLDAYQGAHRDLLLLELMDMRIWCAALAKDETEVAYCLTMLEERGKQSESGQQFAEALAYNFGNLQHDKLHQTARHAAQAALNLAHHFRLKQNFILGVTYNLAAAKYECDDIEGAVATLKPLLTLPSSAENDMLRGAAMQLLSIIEREAGRFERSVDLAQNALAHIPDSQQQIFIKFNLAKSLSGVGKYQDAVEHFQEAWHLAQDQANFPKKTLIEFAGCVGIAAAHIGWQEKCDWALARLAELAAFDPEHREWYQKSIEQYAEVRRRIDAVGSFKETTPLLEQVTRFARYSDLGRKPQKAKKTLTLAQANALTLAPLLTWWKDVTTNPGAAAIDLDYWGRGGFAQILSNMRAFPSAFNVMLEVRSIEEIRTIIRLWGLYADFILLVWKGATVSGDFTTLLDAEYFGPWGKGYTMALGSTTKEASGRQRAFSIGYATRLPDTVIQFMQTEVRELLAAGKLLIVPASVVGCISPGWGPMEQCIAEAGNAIPGTRAKFDEVMGLGSLPYSPDLPIPALLEFADKYVADFIEMRKTLATQVAAYRQAGIESTDQRLQREIQDLLRMAAARQQADKITKKQRRAEESIGLATSPFRNGLRLDAVAGAPRTFEPLLALQTMGYGWKMGGLTNNDHHPPYQVTKGETLGTWLCPPEPSMSFLMVRKVENSK